MAKFSLPIYQNKPIVILTSNNQVALFSKFTTLKEIIANPSLIMGRMAGFSYGAYIDKLLADTPPKIHEIASKQSLFPRLLERKRISYRLTVPEEIEMLTRSAGLGPDDFTAISMPDVPTGNQRYLMFSKNVVDSLIESINQSGNWPPDISKRI